MYNVHCSSAITALFPGEGVDIGGRAGSRVLCLDGGGIRGLIQIEVLAQVYTCTCVYTFIYIYVYLVLSI